MLSNFKVVVVDYGRQELPLGLEGRVVTVFMEKLHMFEKTGLFVAEQVFVVENVLRINARFRVVSVNNLMQVVKEEKAMESQQ